jgi:hypothetical protein
LASRAVLRLSLACNNRCIFCAQDGLADRVGQLRAGGDEITFVGGEPTLDPRLPELIAQARALGYRRIGVQTNARGFDPARLPGLTDVHVSIHGADAAVHDYHTGAPGSARETWAGVAAARAAGLTVVVATVLTRSNFRVLGALPAALRSRGVAGWLIMVPRAAGRLAFDRVMPRLGLALPFALHALDAARKTGLPAWISGAPLCALGPFTQFALSEPPRAYGAACEGCGARTNCSGVDPAYLERFGGDEIAPIAEASVAAADDIARMFVGIGELAPQVTVATHQSLPVLGRPQPGKQEVSASAAKKSGEALREIFPTLFED